MEESEIGEWNLQGLPTDELSIQNGIMVTRATRYPVLVDPQGQGVSWIKNREEQNQLRGATLTDKMFRNHLEDCLTYGKPMLIENIEEELDPILDPVLEKRVVRKGKNLIIQLDKEVDFSESFTLFCTTRLPNPHFSPEMSAKVTVIDFTVTAVGCGGPAPGEADPQGKARAGGAATGARGRGHVVQEEDQAARGRPALPPGQLDGQPAGRHRS